MVVYHHVTAYLSRVKSVVPYLQQTHHLVGDDVEDEDVQRVVACIYQEFLDQALCAVNPAADVIGHQEAQQCGYGQREELGIGRAPVHVSRQVFGEHVDDDGEDQRHRERDIQTGCRVLIAYDELSEDESTAEEETSHHVAIAALNEIGDTQTLVGLPATEQEHQQTDEIGCEGTESG